MSVMRAIDTVAEFIMPAEVAAERVKVVEPPLGELSRVHELMGNMEAREDIRVSWQLSDLEMEEMGKTFDEIAILHDLLNPGDIRKVLGKRKKEMRNIIWRELFTVIHKVRQRNSNNKLDPTPPDGGSGNFGEEVEKMISLIDSKEPLGLISDQVASMVKSSVREVYRQEENLASEALNANVILPIKHVFDLQKAWIIVRGSVDHPPSDGDSLTKLEQALRIIGNEQQPSWSNREIEEELLKNVKAITTIDFNSETADVKKIREKIIHNLYKNPDDMENALNTAFGIVDKYIKLEGLENFMSDKEYLNVVVTQLSRSGEMVPGSLLYNRLATLTVGNARARLDKQVEEFLKETRLKDKLTSLVNDPPHRREALSKWREYVQTLLKRRSTEARQVPLQELIKLYKFDGGQIAMLENERPELWENIKRYIDMSEEAFGEDMSYLLEKMWDG